MAKKTERKINQLIKLLYKTGGSVKTSCNAIGISRTIFYKWKEDDKNLAVAFEESRHMAVLDVEDALFEKAKDGNVGAIVFILANLMPEKWRHVTKINANKAVNELEGQTTQELMLSIAKMADQLGVDMPTLDGVEDIPFEDVNPSADA